MTTTITERVLNLIDAHSTATLSAKADVPALLVDLMQQRPGIELCLVLPDRDDRMRLRSAAMDMLLRRRLSERLCHVTASQLGLRLDAPVPVVPVLDPHTRRVQTFMAVLRRVVQAHPGDTWLHPQDVMEEEPVVAPPPPAASAPVSMLHIRPVPPMHTFALSLYWDAKAMPTACSHAQLLCGWKGRGILPYPLIEPPSPPPPCPATRT